MCVSAPRSFRSIRAINGCLDPRNSAALIRERHRWHEPCCCHASDTGKVHSTKGLAGDGPSGDMGTSLGDESRVGTSIGDSIVQATPEYPRNLEAGLLGRPEARNSTIPNPDPEGGGSDSHRFIG